MKKDNYIIFLFIILFFICIKYFGNDIDNITKGIDNLIVYLKEERINIDNNEIYSYSENNENKKDTPSYYKNYEFDKELYIYYTYLNDNERVVYKQIYEQMVLPCVCLIENHSYEEAMHLYYEMTRRLQKQYAL